MPSREWRTGGWTIEMLSTPPTSTARAPSWATICAPCASACRPDAQKRLTVAPAMLSGRPARITAWRAMLPPVAASG